MKNNTTFAFIIFKINILAVFPVLISGCISFQAIKAPSEGLEQEKIARFEYMESNWSYLNSRWIRGNRVTPEKLSGAYAVPEEQATAEIKEFVNSQYSYNLFHRFLISIYLDNINFYVED